MIKDIKDTIEDYAIIGSVMAVITVSLRPFVSIKKTLRDATITFVFSMLSGLIIEYWEIPFAVKAGVCGTIGFFGITLYNVLESILLNLKENPNIIMDKLK